MLMKSRASEFTARKLFKVDTMTLNISSSCRALYSASAGRHTDPEVYPRPDGTVNLLIRT